MDRDVSGVPGAQAKRMAPIMEFKDDKNHERIEHLLSLMPKNRSSILDIGCREGTVTRQLTTYFDSITALDLEKPNLAIENVIPIAGDVTRLEFPDNSFDVVLCAEVLEHIEPDLLRRACDEISRVARYEVIIGVPYKQDTRVSRTVCRSCGKKNPPYGHVNCFDQPRLRQLFNTLMPVQMSLIGGPARKTNALSVFLSDLAGNPWGTYGQKEPCVYCGSELVQPNVNTVQRILAKTALIMDAAQNKVRRPDPYWLHAIFAK